MSAADDVIIRLPADGIALAAIERAALLAALEACAWVQTDAAKWLHITPRVIHYKIHVHEIALPVDHPNVTRYAWRRAMGATKPGTAARGVAS